MAEVRAKRIYDPAEPADGYRVLVDHVWPRGVFPERARLDEWARELSPGDDCVAFGHVPERFGVFRSGYRDELKGKCEQSLRRGARDGPVTMLYAARDREHNNAVVLAELVRDG